MKRASSLILTDAPPDILAFLITLAMMQVFFEGVKRSVLFNNILNVINLASWMIIVLVGLWFIKASNWSDFMPFGFRYYTYFPTAYFA